MEKFKKSPKHTINCAFSFWEMILLSVERKVNAIPLLEKYVALTFYKHASFSDDAPLYRRCKSNNHFTGHTSSDTSYLLISSPLINTNVTTSLNSQVITVYPAPIAFPTPLMLILLIYFKLWVIATLIGKHVASSISHVHIFDLNVMK